MVNPEPGRRDAAWLVALAEAVAELAEAHGARELASAAHSTARRFSYTVTPTDPVTVALYRHELTRLLDAVHHPTPSPPPELDPLARTPGEVGQRPHRLPG